MSNPMSNIIVRSELSNGTIKHFGIFTPDEAKHFIANLLSLGIPAQAIPLHPIPGWWRYDG